MSVEYRVPKRTVLAQVCFQGSSSSTLRLYLGDRAESHMGKERPGDLLNGADAFIPTTTPEGEFILLNKDAVTTVAIDGQDDMIEEIPCGDDDPSTDATRFEATVHLSDCTTRKGWISFLHPYGQRRPQCLLNTEDRFLLVHNGIENCFINKRHILKLSFSE